MAGRITQEAKSDEAENGAQKAEMADAGDSIGRNLVQPWEGLASADGHQDNSGVEASLRSSDKITPQSRQAGEVAAKVQIAEPQPVENGGTGELGTSRSPVQAPALAPVKSDLGTSLGTSNLVQFPNRCQNGKPPDKSTSCDNLALMPSTNAKPVQALMPSLMPAVVPKLAWHQLNITGWSPVRVGHGRSIRLRLGTAAPDTGKMSRYYKWVPEENYDEWKKGFSIEKLIIASRNAERVRLAARRRAG